MNVFIKKRVYCSHYIENTQSTMIISIASLKGGVGKSTISQNLAVCFANMDYRVAIVDADKNDSCQRWLDMRDIEKHPPILVSGSDSPQALRKNLTLLSKDYDLIIIDGTPDASKLVSTIMLVGDLLLIPIKPSMADLWASEKFRDRYEEAVATKGAPIPAYLILNEYSGNMSFNQDVKAGLQDFGFPILSTTVKTRQAYKEAMADGLGVYEYTNATAKSEMINLTKEVLEIIQQING